MFKMSFLRWKEEGEVVKKKPTVICKWNKCLKLNMSVHQQAHKFCGVKNNNKKKWNSFPNKSEKDSKAGSNQYHPVINRKC